VKVSAFLGLSLDGFLARPDGSIDWLEPFHDPEDDAGYGAFFAEVDTLLVGRATWETVAGFADWPWAGRRVVVRTRRGLDARHGEEAAAGTVAALLARLAADGARHVYVDGGQTVGDALREGVLDELTVTVVPVVLGAGRRLWDGLPEQTWRLLDARRCARGLTQARYATRPAGAGGG
jgi:dihydrofolate reductase